MVAERRPRSGSRPARRPALDGARLGSAPVLAVGAAAVRDVSVSVPAGDDLPPRAVGRARAARAARSADARQPVPRGAGRVLPRAAGTPARCRSRRERAAARPSSASTTVLRSRRRANTRNGWRRRSIASGATRSTSCGATSASGSRSIAPTSRTWVPDVLRVQLRPDRRGPRPAQPAGSGHDRRPASCCAARSTSSSDRADVDVLRVTDHKTGKNRSNHDLIVGGGAVLQPVLYSVAIEQGLGKTRRRGPAVLLHDRRRISRMHRSRSTTTRAARACRC